MGISDKRSVIFYAPIGSTIKGYKNGGAEAGCRKTMAVLQSAGYKIILIEKPARKSFSKLGGLMFIFTLLSVWIKSVSIFLRNKHSVFHVAGFYLNQIYFENLLIKTAKFIGIKTIYEIRNGGMIEAYNEGGSRYKKFMLSTLKNADLVLCQGLDYVTFIQDHLNKPSVYYPNYILDKYISGSNPVRRFDQIQLVYFGRVVPDKNVDFIIEVCNELNIKKMPFHLDIIGGYEPSYHEQLTQRIKYYNLDNARIKFHGRMDFDMIYTYLKQAHFFVFPSKEKREGHSNSLTEAMGAGLVPVVSTAGFNESIVGESNLVVKEFDAKLYAKVISDVWESGQWQNYSDMVYHRVINNFTEDIVKHSLLNAYQNI
ncbi:glycosyltransferase family 4 protein [Mucilaginibacter litoreus]|uniref:Glycosyltransferase family 4 protein n=1 Tax=Mucilaginibacter litoreus TaxID=1048221 RepID=A0ABW3AV81_9SPHI